MAFKSNVISLEIKFNKASCTQELYTFLLMQKKKSLHYTPKNSNNNYTMSNSKMDFFFFFFLQTPMFSLAIFLLNYNKYAQNNKSIKYHFTKLTLTQIHLDKNTTNQRLFWKITLGGDTLCVIVSCNLRVWEAVNPLVRSIGKGMETNISGQLQPFITIYKEFKFFLHTYIH